MKTFAMIVAMDQARGLGKAGQLAWHVPADLKRFKQITASVKDPSKQNAVIMGRKTWESLPEKFRPLPGRLNIVLTRQEDFKLPPGVLLFPDFDQALAHAQGQGNIESIFLIGGAQLFSQTIDHPACHALYVTEVEGKFDCDVFFPPIPARFKRFTSSPRLSEGGISFRFDDYLYTPTGRLPGSV